MTLTRSRCVLFLVLSLSSNLADAQEFSGPYVGVEAGMQHYIGGSLVNGVDTLQQDSRLVMSLVGGFRIQARGFVVGGELGRGWADGDLHLDAAPLTIDYANGSQGHWQLHAGHTLGERTLLFGYVSEVTRHFEVSITQAGQSTAQEDEQGMLRFGAGLEQRLTRLLRLRITMGTSRADFGGRQTSITPGRQLEAGGGLVVQF